MKVMNLARHYSGLAKVTDLTCYNQAINPGFFEHIYIYIYI